MKFVQIVAFSTTEIDQLRKMSDEMPEPPEGGGKGTVCADRDNPNRYMVIAEFDSYEQAMANSARPEVSEFAARKAELCDGPPTFYNLDVIEEFPRG
ncbi:MAG: hypothetical protein ACRD0D_15015 [Acidimicrobiales bacterium]